MKSKIGIIRALDVRLQHAEFAASFHTLKPIFAADTSPEIEKYLYANNVTFENIPLKPKAFIDPIFPLLKKTDFTPWLELDRDILNKVMEKAAVFEIYEPYFFYSSQIAELAKKKDVPLVTEIWTSFPEHPARYVPPYSSNVQRVIKQTDLFVLRSNKALSYLRPYKIPINKTAILYHGINTERFYPKRNDQKDKEITILFVGALASHKGLDDLLAVFKELVQKYPNQMKLTICGEGPLLRHVLQLTDELPINYLGKVSNLELPEIYRDADIYCQPSKDYYFIGIKGGEEFAGYTFMEALASGLPIVSTYCGGIAEIVGSENSLIEQGNRKALFNAITSYIENPQLRTETGIKNRERAEMLFNISHQTRKFEALLNDKLL